MTKKRKAGSSSKPKQSYPLPKPGPVTLKQFLDGQRKINGSFYEVLDEVMKVLKANNLTANNLKASKSSKAANSLNQVSKLVDAVPHVDPPGCVSPGGTG
jgi:hypothetical protein